MKSMYLFEMKKIFRRKIVWAGILLTLLLSVAGFSSMGIGDISYEQEIADKYEGILDDEKVQQMLQDFMPTKEQLEQWKIPVYAIGLNSMQQAVHRNFANDDGTWNGKTVKDVYGDQEIRVGYHAGWFDFSRNLIKVVIALAVLSVIIAAPVFAGEYNGMDNILLTSRYGRTKCASAKILAALSAVLLILGVFLIGNLAAALILMGTKGLDSSTLFCGMYYENYMPFNISCGTMILYQVGLAISGVIMVVGITVFVSAVSKSEIVSLIVSALVLLCPLMLSVSETKPIFRIIGMLPIWQVQFTSLMSIGRLSGNLFYAVVAAPVSIAVMMAAAILAKRCWGRHQVG